MLAHTQRQFSDEIQRLLGRGRRHAGLLYTQWIREGRSAPEAWAEPQALSLVAEILLHSDRTVPEISRIQEEGGTTKFLLKFADGLESESVIVPMASSATLCISSQIGCQRACTFCETGRMGIVRSLTATEIAAQVFIARHHFQAPIRNIVFMGMGEPLDNFDAVMQAIRVFTDPGGFGFGPSRITVSTSGVVPKIYEFAASADPAVNLAVSINAPNDEIRRKVMPVNRHWNMQALKEAMQAYLRHPRREILAEYVLLQGVNDSLECADQLALYLEGMRVKVNLIPYNAQSKSRFAPPTLKAQEAFLARMREHGLQTLLRRHKGRKIMAACGQLGVVRWKKRESAGAA